MATHIDAMVAGLIDSGDLTDPAWADAMRRVPRHAFIPERASVGDHIIDRLDDPEGWLAACYADQAIVTQVDDGRPGGPGIATSSASAPSVVAWMLDALDVQDEERILEIGTGTGWNAGLLCARVGSGNVTTVEIDQAIANTARLALHRQGWTPTVACTDGADGFPISAPYHRVISTCSVRSVPAAWLNQTVAGGRIVTPWTPGDGAGALLTLDVYDRHAEGRCGAELSFMEMRGQRARLSPPPGHGEDPGYRTVTAVDPEQVLWGDAAFAMRVRLPGVRFGMGADHMWVGAGASWARVNLDDGRVEAAGGLWDRVEEAWAWWQANGRPGSDRFGLTVDGTGQFVWLDNPRNVVVNPR